MRGASFALSNQVVNKIASHTPGVTKDHREEEGTGDGEDHHGYQALKRDRIMVYLSKNGWLGKFMS